MSIELKSSREFFVPILNVKLLFLWSCLAALILLAEVMPVPYMSPMTFYSLFLLKGVAFVSLGFLIPLTYERFDGVVRALLFSLGIALLTELLQKVLQHGHSFVWYELLIKPVLILWGFAIALVARYEGRFLIGSVRINLVGHSGE